MTQITVFPKGTIVKFNGIPCQLLQDTPYYSRTFQGRQNDDELLEAITKVMGTLGKTWDYIRYETNRPAVVRKKISEAKKSIEKILEIIDN